MTRTFAVKENTAFKLHNTKQTDPNKPTDFLVTPKGVRLNLGDFIEDAGTGHLKVMLEGYLYGEHIEEVSKEVKEILPFNKGVKLFGNRYTKARHDDLQRCLSTFNITKRNQIRHFLSQCGHESAGLRYTVELASGKAYEFRKDLGNTQAGWGEIYKGSGFIQLTGRVNYVKLFNFVKDQNVLTQGAKYVGRVYPWTSAGVWWNANGMNAYIDRGATVRQVSRRVNGGYNGLADRERWYKLTSII